ncbi:MAG: universal stress protein [Flavobacteriaceae bacterium]|nr:universal stress protein [Flavobacteriaceae bacterium]
MKIVNHILAAVDFRQSSEVIVQNSIEMARKFNAKLYFTYVLPDDIKQEKVSSLVEKAALEQLEQISNQAKNHGIEMGDPVLKHGEYSENVILAAQETGANLVIIGSGEKKKGDSFPLGTTAGKIIRKSFVPVLVIKNNESLNQINRILCPVDFSEESSAALNNAIAVARIFDAKLLIMSVYTPFVQTITRIDPDEVNQQRNLEQAQELQLFLEKHTLINLEYEIEIRGGNPADEILDVINKKEIDLLVMGTTGKSGISKILLGSVAEKVTREVACSFIISKKEDFLNFETRARNVEEHFAAGESLFEKGFYEQAIHSYKSGLELNLSHVPSIRGLVKTYEKLGNEAKAIEYRRMITNIMEQFHNFKIEEEIRQRRI